MTTASHSWTCVANVCGQHSESWTTWDEAVVAMRTHARDVAHDPRWPLTFRTSIGVHYEPSGLATA